MNTFVVEKFDDEGSRCSFYTVRWEDADQSETEKFFRRYRRDEKHREHLQMLAKFLEKVIGERHGALEDFFRFENSAQGLPPSGQFQVGELEMRFHDFPLRLYCLRISERLVVLFNGGEKTSRTAQGGKTSMAFHDANQFAKRIEKALRSGEMEIVAGGRVLWGEEMEGESVFLAD